MEASAEEVVRPGWSNRSSSSILAVFPRQSDIYMSITKLSFVPQLGLVVLQPQPSYDLDLQNIQIPQTRGVSKRSRR